MKHRALTLLALAAVVPLLTAQSCSGGSAAPPAKATQAQKAQERANAVTFTENAEIDNIERRLKLTSNPGQIGFILLLNGAGQPIFYSGVRGKVTSGGKRLTKPYALAACDQGEAYGECVVPAPSDEGTHGSSGEYIYLWTTAGAYMQWNGPYAYSDKPFRLRVEPLVVSVAPVAAPPRKAPAR